VNEVGNKIKRNSSKLEHGELQGNIPHDVESLVFKSNRNARSLLGYETASKLMVLPLSIIVTKNGAELFVAVPEGVTSEIKTNIKFVVDKEIHFIEVKRSILVRAIFDAYYGDAESLKGLIGVEKIGAENDKVNGAIFSLEPKARFTAEILNKEESGAARFLSSLINYSIARSASDLHIYPDKDGPRASVRISGLLFSHEESLCSNESLNQIISLTKILSKLDTTLRRTAQDGSFVYEAGSDQVNIRVSVIPTIYGEKVVYRFLGRGDLKKLSDIGFNTRTLRFVKKFLGFEDGLALFSGPTGSGKSTSLYASVIELRDQGLGVITVENPVELYVPGIVQTEVDEAQRMTYANSLKAILRQDPDAILLGEIRDKESAEAVIQSSHTGHLILSTIHGRNVFDCIKRMKSFGMDPYAVGDVAKLLVFQRLIPKLCDRCKIIDLDAVRALGALDREKVTSVYRASSCEVCGYSGVKGRVLATEALLVDSAVSRLIKAGQFDLDTLKSTLTTDNYISLEESLMGLIADGFISLDTVDN